MASITLTIDDQQLARWKAAYGVATNAELKAALIAKVKQVVVNYEVQEAELTAAAALDTAKNTYSASIASAHASSESEINIT